MLQDILLLLLVNMSDTNAYYKFVEYWEDECQICLANEHSNVYLVNECKCTHLICRNCFRKLYACPFCRAPFIKRCEPVVGVLMTQSALDLITTLLPRPQYLTSNEFSTMSDMEVETWFADGITSVNADQSSS